MIGDMFSDIFTRNGWISGSYVREKIIRGDDKSSVSDIDILIPFEYFDLLKKRPTEKYNARHELIDYNKEESIAHSHFFIGEYILDIFSCTDHCYLSPPDVDVNTLCWTGSKFVSWFLIGDAVKENEQLYSVLFDINSVVKRCLKKEGIAFTKEWEFIGKEFEVKMKERVNKLVTRGWKILNTY